MKKPYAVVMYFRLGKQFEIQESWLGFDKAELEGIGQEWLRDAEGHPEYGYEVVEVEPVPLLANILTGAIKAEWVAPEVAALANALREA